MMADDVVEGVETFFFILQTKKSACVTLGQIMFCEQAAAVRGEPQQAQLIGQSGGGAAQQARIKLSIVKYYFYLALRLGLFVVCT